MAPKKAAAVEPSAEDEEEKAPTPPPPTEDEVTELETGLQLPLRGNDVGDIWALDRDYEAQAKLLSGMLGLEEAYPEEARRGIVVDFYLYNLSHAKALCLTKRQAAVFHAIMDRMLAMAKSSEAKEDSGPADMEHSAADCFKEFQALLLQHVASSAPGRMAVFKVPEAKLLTEFAAGTLFKHFLLYQFCLNCTQEMQVLRFRSGVGIPAPPPKLSVAKLRPRPRPADEGGEVAAGEAEADEGEAGEDDEDDEVRRIVEAKLRETEAALQAKLDAREVAFQEKLATKKATKK